MLYVFALIFYSRSNTNLFFNTLLFISSTTCFLFKINVGAYAGFVFLCEIVSFFTLYIILNKIEGDILTSSQKYNYLNSVSIVMMYFIIGLILPYSETLRLIHLNYFFFDNWCTNDFLSLALVFYTNTYNIYFIVASFVPLVSYLIIWSVICTSQNINNAHYIKTSHLRNYLRLFILNNNLHSKKMTFINFFIK